MHFMNCQLVRCISLFIGGRMHFMNCQLVRCILSIYGREDAFHELSTREMHPLYLWKGECISWTVNSWDASLYLWKWGCISWTVNSWDASLYLWKGGCISWTVNSWDASSLFMGGRMHFMNCQLVRCILSIYGRENAFHELSTREMHPLYLWKWGCISWTVNSWDASSLFMEGRMHFMNCQLVRCILSIYGRENAFHELSTREMHPLNLWKVECISWINSWDASSLFMKERMHFMNCQLVRCILSIYGREDAFHELSTCGMHPLLL